MEKQLALIAAAARRDAARIAAVKANAARNIFAKYRSVDEGPLGGPLHAWFMAGDAMRAAHLARQNDNDAGVSSFVAEAMRWRRAAKAGHGAFAIGATTHGRHLCVTELRIAQ